MLNPLNAVRISKYSSFRIDFNNARDYFAEKLYSVISKLDVDFLRKLLSFFPESRKFVTNFLPAYIINLRQCCNQILEVQLDRMSKVETYGIDESVDYRGTRLAKRKERFRSGEIPMRIIVKIVRTTVVADASVLVERPVPSEETI